MSERIEVYTDGGCRGNPGPGGWGVVIDAGPHQGEYSGFSPQTTNNQMELLAAISALETLDAPARIRLHTDSRYVVDGIKKWLKNWQRRGWKTVSGQPVANQALWIRLDTAAKRHDVQWQWVKGHAGNAGNERADALANEAMNQGLSGQVRVSQDLGAGLYGASDSEAEAILSNARMLFTLPGLIFRRK